MIFYRFENCEDFDVELDNLIRSKMLTEHLSVNTLTKYVLPVLRENVVGVANLIASYTSSLSCAATRHLRAVRTLHNRIWLLQFYYHDETILLEMSDFISNGVNITKWFSLRYKTYHFERYMGLIGNVGSLHPDKFTISESATERLIFSWYKNNYLKEHRYIQVEYIQVEEYDFPHF